MEFRDLAIIIATLLGPIFAVQAQKFLEKRRELKDRQEWVFRILMTTRASGLAPAHVEALNSVPITFYGDSKKLKHINQAWRSYLDHLGEKNMSHDVWAPKRLDLLIDLMHTMSVFLGYSFTKSQLRNDIYSPQAYGKAEEDAGAIRQGLIEVLQGKRPIPMDVKSFPFQETGSPPDEKLKAAESGKD